MAEQTIKIKTVTQKTSKAGKPFWSVETSDGKKLSVWEKDISDQLLEGDTVKVEVLKKDQYSNIVDFNEVVKKASIESPAIQQSSYDISYAKDILVAMIENINIKDEKFDVLIAAKLAAQCVNNIKEVLNGDNKEGVDPEADSKEDAEWE